MELLRINRNLKFIPQKEIPHRLRNYIIYQFIGIRKNYFILNSNYRKRNFVENLKLLRNISYKSPNTILITEFERLKLNTRRTLIHKNEWIPGFLLRYYGIKKIKELRKLPLLMINISNGERSIPILEALKINIITFSFTTMKKKSFILSDFSYPINFNQGKFSRLVTDIVIVNTINNKYYKNLYFREYLQYLLNKMKRLHAIKIKKFYTKIHRKNIKIVLKLKKWVKVRKKLKKKLMQIHKKNRKKLIQLREEFAPKTKNKYKFYRFIFVKKKLKSINIKQRFSNRKYNKIKL